MENNMQGNPFIGIDLGTTFCSIARWTNEGAEVYSPKGQKTFQAVIYYDEKNERFLYDKTAFMSGMLNPDNMCIGVKRFMGDKDMIINFGKIQLSPVDISAMILNYVYMNVKNMFPEGFYSPSGIVITVPYYFKVHQCKNTSEAAKRAGLDITAIIQEPIAAAFAYGLHLSKQSENREETILVFDLGGGTFDITIFKLIEDEKELCFDVMTTGGDDRLGGMDFDYEFMNYIIEKEKIKLESLGDERTLKVVRQKLIKAAMEAKEELSSSDTAYIAVLDIIPGVHIDNEYSREEFEISISYYTEKIKNILLETIEKAGLKAKDITKVIKVGGSSKIPIMDDIIKEVVGDNKIYSDVDPSLCVAQGAAIYSAYIGDSLNLKKDIKIRTCMPHSLGIEGENGVFVPIIKANEKIPAERTVTFTTTEDNCTSTQLNIYQGHLQIAKNNSHVGTIKIDGLVPAPKGGLAITVKFKILQSQEVLIRVKQEESKIDMLDVLKLQ